MNKRQVTIEFATVWERQKFEKWYRRGGSTSFFGYLGDSGKRGRKIAQLKLDKWPNKCEKFV